MLSPSVSSSLLHQLRNLATRITSSSWISCEKWNEHQRNLVICTKKALPNREMCIKSLRNEFECSEWALMQARDRFRILITWWLVKTRLDSSIELPILTLSGFRLYAPITDRAQIKNASVSANSLGSSRITNKLCERAFQTKRNRRMKPNLAINSIYSFLIPNLYRVIGILCKWMNKTNDQPKTRKTNEINNHLN